MEGTLYLGYPILASAEGPVSVDGLLCCREHGLVAFDFEGFEQREEVRKRQDEIYTAIFKKLLDTPELRRGRQGLIVEIGIVTVVPGLNGIDRSEEDDVVLVSPADIFTVTAERDPIDEHVLKMVNASIERVSNLKPHAKRPQVTREDYLRSHVVLCRGQTYTVTEVLEECQAVQSSRPPLADSMPQGVQ